MLKSADLHGIWAFRPTQTPSGLGVLARGTLVDLAPFCVWRPRAILGGAAEGSDLAALPNALPTEQRMGALSTLADDASSVT